jgi:hypothetical protein
MYSRDLLLMLLSGIINHTQYSAHVCTPCYDCSAKPPFPNSYETHPSVTTAAMSLIMLAHPKVGFQSTPKTLHFQVKLVVLVIIFSPLHLASVYSCQLLSG